MSARPKWRRLLQLKTREVRRSGKRREPAGRRLLCEEMEPRLCLSTIPGFYGLGITTSHGQAYRLDINFADQTLTPLHLGTLNSGPSRDVALMPGNPVGEFFGATGNAYPSTLRQSDIDVFNTDQDPAVPIAANSLGILYMPDTTSQGVPVQPRVFANALEFFGESLYGAGYIGDPDFGHSYDSRAIFRIDTDTEPGRVYPIYSLNGPNAQGTGYNGVSAGDLAFDLGGNLYLSLVGGDVLEVNLTAAPITQELHDLPAGTPDFDGLVPLDFDPQGVATSLIGFAQNRNYYEIDLVANTATLRGTLQHDDPDLLDAGESVYGASIGYQPPMEVAVSDVVNENDVAPRLGQLWYELTPEKSGGLSIDLLSGGTAGSWMMLYESTDAPPVAQGQSSLTVAATAGQPLYLHVVDLAHGELADLQFENSAWDFGDAPDAPYPTLLADDGARHDIEEGFHLGATIDAEVDGQPDPFALGDNHDGNIDEDGVSFLQSFQHTQSTSIEVVLADGTAAGGKLDAWIDWNQDGDWADAAEQVFSGEVLIPDTNNLSITTPGTAQLGYAAARFRLSRDGVADPFGAAPDGEVEDYMILVKDIDGMDFGDAPESYPTYSGSVGAVHGRGDLGLYLGELIDHEYDGQPTTDATGDDANNPAGEDGDEDGVELLTPLLPGTDVQFEVTASKAGFVNAWLDGNADGDWDDPGEHFIADVAVTAGANVLTHTLPTQIVTTDPLLVRFRLSSQAGLDSRGWAPDGEVEDYAVEFATFTSWEAETDLYHVIGRLDGDGWSADPAQDSPSFLSFGPYTTNVPTGQHTVRFLMKVDDVSANSLPVATVDVLDAATGQVLAQRIVHRSAFAEPDTYEFIELTFGNQAGGVLEFRVFWHGTAYMKLDRIDLVTDMSIGSDPADLLKTFEAEQDLYHVIGRADGDGWSANVADDSASYLSFGPYITSVPAGEHMVSWELMVQDNTTDNLPVVTVDVFDASGGQLLAQRIIRRGEFTTPLVYQPFVVQFTTQAGRALEFRTFYHDTSYVNLDKVNLFVNHVFQAEHAFYHQIGRPDGDGWLADPAQDAAGHMSYGPYTPLVPTGQYAARFRMKVDDVSANSLSVATVDVLDGSTGQILAQRIVHRSAFAQPDTYEFIDLTFGNQAGGLIEFHVFWHGAASMKLDRVELVADMSISSDPADLLRTYEAEQDLYHVIGRPDGDGWSANAGDDTAGFLAFGPYTNLLPAGEHMVSWQLMVDDNTADNLPVVTVDVFDYVSGQLLARRTIRRSEFTAPLTYQPFLVQFTTENWRSFEFRTYYHDTSYVNLDKVDLFVNHVFQAEHTFFHQIGRPDGDGWSADPAQDAAGYLTYGPYTTYVPGGQHVAWFELMVNDHTGDNEPVVTIDAFDANTGELLAQRTIRRGEFDGSFAYQRFGLEFSAERDRLIEVRSFWHGTSYAKLNYVEIEQDAAIAVNTSTPLEVYGMQAVYHQIGREQGGDWLAETDQDNVGYLSYGPYTRDVPGGTHAARFRLIVDDNTGDNQTVATIDVFDAGNGRLLAKRIVRRQDFTDIDTYQDFDLLFNVDDNQLLEFRVFWHDVANMTINSITILGGQDH